VARKSGISTGEAAAEDPLIEGTAVDEAVWFMVSVSVSVVVEPYVEE
jgi:hypothetical protein